MRAGWKKLSAVVFASDDTLLTRYLYEYTFRALDPSSIKASKPEDHEGDPDYEKEEYPGHWIMTDVHYIGGDGKEVRDGDMTIKAERYGVEGQEMVYTFTKDGDPNVYIRPTNCFLSLQGSFPEGEKAGEKIWLTYGFMDGYSGNVRMYNLYEYTWVPGPDICWNYNPGMTY